MASENFDIRKLLARLAHQTNDIEKLRGREAGSLLGTIVNVDDPERIGRVQVSLDVKGDSIASDWAHVQGFFKGRVPSEFIGSRVILSPVYGDGEYLVVTGFIQTSEGGIGAGPTRAPSSVTRYTCSKENEGMLLVHQRNDSVGTSWFSSASFEVCMLSGGEYLWVPAGKEDVIYPNDPRYANEEFAADEEYNLATRSESLTTLTLPPCRQGTLGWKYTMGLNGWEPGTGDPTNEPAYGIGCYKTQTGDYRWRMEHAPPISEDRPLQDVSTESTNWEPNCEKSLEGELRTIQTSDGGSYLTICQEASDGSYVWRLSVAPVVGSVDGGDGHNVTPSCSETMRGEMRLLKGSTDYFIVCMQDKGSMKWVRLAPFFHRHPQLPDIAGDIEKDVEFPYVECPGGGQCF